MNLEMKFEEDCKWTAARLRLARHSKKKVFYWQGFTYWESFNLVSPFVIVSSFLLFWIRQSLFYSFQIRYHF